MSAFERLREQESYPGEEIGEYGEYVPSPEEIRRQCREIRKSWSDGERRQRSCERNKRWEVPVTKAAMTSQLARIRD